MDWLQRHYCLVKIEIFWQIMFIEIVLMILIKDLIPKTYVTCNYLL